MAIESNKYASSLNLEVIVSTDDKGNVKKKNKSIFKVKPGAKDEQLYKVAEATSKVLKYEMLSVNRIDKNTLVE